MEENINIPVGWHLKQVVEFASKMQSGGTPKSDNLEYYNGEIPFVAIDDLSKSNKYISKTQKKITNKGLINSSAWLVPKYSLLYSIYATLGVPRINLIEVATNQAILNILPNKKIISLEFLYYLLLEKRNTILSHSAHTTQSNLNAKVVKELEFVFPKSTVEQNKIAEILSKVDKAISETEVVIAKYNRIKTGLMQDLLTKGIDEKGNIRSEETHEFKDSPLGRIPDEWDFLPIANVYDLKSGITPLRSNKKYFSSEGHNWVKTLDLNEDYLFETEERVSDFALSNTSLKLMPVNSILIAMYGGWEQIGRTAILKKEAGTNQAITCLSNPKFEMNSDFVQLLLQYYRFKWKQFAVSTRKDPNITKTDIENFILTFPKDITEQNKIADKINSIKENISLNEVELNKLKSIKTGLMQDLLSGKKRVTHLIN
jgi:type I restriction enzyme S subunit